MIRVFEHWECHRSRWVVFWAEVASAVQSPLESAVEFAVCVGWAEVDVCLSVSSVSADFFAVPLWQGGHPGMWFQRSIAGCLSIAAFTFLCPANSTPRSFSSRTSARGFLMRYCVSSTAARENPSLAILAIFKPRRTSVCSSCTRPPCLAIVADMLNTYKKFVAASNNEMRLLHQLYMLP